MLKDGFLWKRRGWFGRICNTLKAFLWAGEKWQSFRTRYKYSCESNPNLHGSKWTGRKKGKYKIEFFPCLKYPGNGSSKQVFLSYSSVRPNYVIPAWDTVWWYKCHLPFFFQWCGKTGWRLVGGRVFRTPCTGAGQVQSCQLRVWQGCGGRGEGAAVPRAGRSRVAAPVCVSLQGHSAHPGERRERVLPGVQGEILQGHGDGGQEVRQHPQGGGRGRRLLPPVQPDLQLRDPHPRRALCHRQGR